MVLAIQLHITAEQVSRSMPYGLQYKNNLKLKNWNQKSGRKELPFRYTISCHSIRTPHDSIPRPLLFLLLPWRRRR
jgi:hypothetical protein